LQRSPLPRLKDVSTEYYLRHAYGKPGIGQ
jgi:hypothetical protein